MPTFVTTLTLPVRSIVWSGITAVSRTSQSLVGIMWFEDYVGIPFVDLGRDRSGIDCYGLIRLLYSERLSVEMPDYQYERGADFSLFEMYRFFYKVELSEHTEYDILWLRSPMGDGELLNHLGICVGSDYVLEACDKVGPVLHRFPHVRNVVAGAYRLDWEALRAHKDILQLRGNLP